MTITWQLVATIQAQILLLIAGITWLLSRRGRALAASSLRTQPGGGDSAESSEAQPREFASRSRIAMHDTSTAHVAEAATHGDAVAHGVQHNPTQLAWLRLRGSLSALLEPVHLSGGEDRAQNLHRLLCAADRLHDVASPEPTLRADADDAQRWAPLLAALTDVRAAVRDLQDGGDLPSDLVIVLDAIVAAADELRAAPVVIAPPHTQREQELKLMISQFTTDSRDMLASIRRLENENFELREHLTATAGPP